MKSMTGFGRRELTQKGKKISVEIKAVNHRYLDMNIRLPKRIGFLETAVRNKLKDFVSRGKVDVFIFYEDSTENTVVLKYHKETAQQYMEYLKQMQEDFGLENNISVSVLSRFPEVFTMEEQIADEEEIWNELEIVLEGAAGEFVKSRQSEGANLNKDLAEKLHEIMKSVHVIQERSPDIVREYRDKLMEKVREMLSDTNIEESRLITETVIFADKICVDEEIVRLSSHVQQMRSALQGEDNIGRKLDFIAQEMNREANTILSKSNDLLVSDIAIDLKTNIEKIREQIQNIE